MRTANRISLLLVIGLLVGSGSCSAAAELSEIKRGSEEFSRIDAELSPWIEAIRRADLHAIVSFSLPEMRDAVTAQIADSSSRLHAFLLGANDSVRTVLQSRGGYGLMLLSHADLASAGHGTTACFYAVSRTAPPVPRDMQSLVAAEKSGGLLCVFLFRADDHLYVSYARASEPED